MEKRLTLALVLSLAFTLVYIQFFAPKPPPRSPEDNPAATGQPEDAAAGGGPTERGGGETVPGPEAAPEAGGAAPGQSGESEPPAGPHTEAPIDDDIVVETDLLDVRLTNVGASISNIWLKDYYVRPGIEAGSPEAGDPESWLEVFHEIEDGIRLGQMWENLDLKARRAWRLDTVPWEVIDSGESTAGAIKRAFRFEDGRGVALTKEYLFYPGERYFDVKIMLENLSSTDIRRRDYLIRAGAGIFKEGEAAFTTGPSATGASVKEGDVDVEVMAGNRLYSSPFTMTGERTRPLLWGGCTNNYFCILFSAEGEAQIARLTMHSLVDSRKLEDLESDFVARQGRTPNAAESESLRKEASDNAGCQAAIYLNTPEIGQREERSFRFFAGPKLPELVDTPPYDIYEPLVELNYGKTMGWINVILLETLRFFNKIIGNWGLAIILLTVLVRGLLYPLQRVQSKSMEGYQKKMAKLKPKLEELKKRFKNNQRKFQEAQMKLMREEGIRPPVFGCLIMLLPIPVFIGLFQILRTAIELRHAPFVGWIDDLSQPDHLAHLPFSIPLLGEWLNLLPLLMLAAWIAQNLAMPKPSDPQQAQMQKMMRFLPFVFLFLLYNYASGLSLYMTTSALIAIVQYKFLKITTPTA